METQGFLENKSKKLISSLFKLLLLLVTWRFSVLYKVLVSGFSEMVLSPYDDNINLMKPNKFFIEINKLKRSVDE